jgi:hypothetical protein
MSTVQQLLFAILQNGQTIHTMDLSGAKQQRTRTIIKQKIAFCGMSVLRRFFPESFETGNHPDSLQTRRCKSSAEGSITDSQIEKKLYFACNIAVNPKLTK